MIFFDLAIDFTHQEPLDNDRGPGKCLLGVPASAARRIEFTIRYGDSPTGLVPWESTRAALTLHSQFTERENGIWEFSTEKPGNLRPGVKELRGVFTGLAVPGRTNTHTSFRNEWLARIEQVRGNCIRGVVKTVSYSHRSSQMMPDLRLRLAVEVKPVERLQCRRLSRYLDSRGLSRRLDCRDFHRPASGYEVPYAVSVQPTA
jgi:hypothetical protein